MTRAVIFDFDFTLADSSRGFLACHEWAARAVGLPAVPVEQALRSVGMALPAAFAFMYGEQGESEAAEYVRLWQGRADEVMAGLTHLYDGVAATVVALKEQELALAIVSQKLRRRIAEILERDGLLDAFDLIVGGEDLTRLKPDPEGLLAAVAALGARSCLYVGDTVIDAQAAQNAGLPFVGVLTGVTRRHEFDGHQSIALLDDVSTLPELCRDWSW